MSHSYKPPRSKYTRRSKSWVLGDVIQVHEVSFDEAQNEIGIHLIDGVDIITERDIGDALECAENDGFKRIFLHKLPSNVIPFRRAA